MLAHLHQQGKYQGQRAELTAVSKDFGRSHIIEENVGCRVIQSVRYSRGAVIFHKFFNHSTVFLSDLYLALMYQYAYNFNGTRIVYLCLNEVPAN